MKPIISLTQMRKALNNSKSGVADDTVFSARALFFIAKRLDELVKLQRKQKLSDYNLFMSYKIKTEGLTFSQALEEWKKREKGA